MEAYADLPPVRIDELSHDPIVLDAGTVVGIASGGLADGKLFPAWNSASGVATDIASGKNAMITMKHHSDGATWGLSASDVEWEGHVWTDGPVKPLGMIYQPIYSFKLQATHPNYKRVDNVGLVTDYLIQIPARSAAERALAPGDIVMVVNGATFEYGTGLTAGADVLGTLEKWPGAAGMLDFVIGRVYKNLLFAADTGASVNETVDNDLANVALTDAGSAEFKGLERVQTVPGLGLAGSGTKGVPSWLLKAQADSSGNFHALTILVRL
jgi:hypothetical protein